jgi:radical SAM-linked protein
MFQRVRIRFRKEGDLRLISHNDLLRAFERLFRRADFRLRMSNGFHPRPHVTFPSALALGTVGLDEVMEFELAESLALEEIQKRLNVHAPPGLTVTSAEARVPHAAKARVEGAIYEIALPKNREAEAAAACEQLLAQATCLLPREGRDRPVDVRAGIVGLSVAEGRLHLELAVAQEGSVRPREVLAALGLAELLASGGHFTRSSVRLAAEREPGGPSAAAPPADRVTMASTGRGLDQAMAAHLRELARTLPEGKVLDEEGNAD